MSSVTPDRAPPEFEAATQVLVVSDSARSRDFYSGALGADVVSEYGGSSVVLRLAGAWLLLVAAGEPTPDKPTVGKCAPSSATRMGTCSRSARPRVDATSTRDAEIAAPLAGRFGEPAFRPSRQTGG